MKFTRITTILGPLCALSLLSGCSSLPEPTAPRDTDTPSQPPVSVIGQAAVTQPIAVPEFQRAPEIVVASRAQPDSSDNFRDLEKPVVTGASQPGSEATRAKLETSNKPDQHEAETVAEVNPVTNDLWHRLRSNFKLANLDQDPRTLRRFENWYSSHPKYFERLTQRAYWFLPYVLSEVEKRGMPGEVALLPAIESAFRPDAVSRSNAVGLWQMISATGRRFGLRQDWWIDGRRDLVQSTRAALDYLDYLEQEFNGDWELALAAYNAGEGNIRRQVKNNRKLNKATDFSSLSLRRETAEYVPKLFAVRNIISNPEKYGIKLKSIPNRNTLAVIDARSQTDLTVAASLTGVSVEQMHFFNQGYKRGVTPPNGPHTLVIPTQYSSELLGALNKLSHEQRMRWARHQVRKGEYLGRIARKHGVTVEAIIKANQLGSNLIQPGQELRIPISTGNYRFARSSSNNFTTQDGDKIHKVRSGDSLWSISRRYSVSVKQLTHWNQIAKSSTLHPGQTLVVGR